MTNVTCTKIGTLNRKITHKINPIHDKERFAALDAAYEELIAEIDGAIINSYICSNLPVLKFIAPVIDILVVEIGKAIIIEETRTIPVNVCGMTRQEITKALIYAVKKGA